MMMIVEALKRRWLAMLHGKQFHPRGLDSCTHSCHNQCRCNALPNYLSRSDTPSPLSPFGLLIIGWLVSQCPPLAFSSPFHTKAPIFVNLFSCPRYKREHSQAIRRHEGHIEVIWVKRLAWFNNHPFRPDRCWAVLANLLDEGATHELFEGHVCEVGGDMESCCGCPRKIGALAWGQCSNTKLCGWNFSQGWCKGQWLCRKPQGYF